MGKVRTLSKTRGLAIGPPIGATGPTPLAASGAEARAGKRPAGSKNGQAKGNREVCNQESITRRQAAYKSAEKEQPRGACPLQGRLAA